MQPFLCWFSKQDSGLSFALTKQMMFIQKYNFFEIRLVVVNVLIYTISQRLEDKYVDIGTDLIFVDFI